MLSVASDLVGLISGVVFLWGTFHPQLSKWWAPLSIVFLLSIVIRRLILARRISEAATITSKIKNASKPSNSKSVTIKEVLELVPRNSLLGSLENYCNKFARQWASDGEFTGGHFYINKADNGPPQLSFQLFFYSTSRGERLTKYLPDGQEKYIVETSRLRIGFEFKQLISTKGWRSRVAQALEDSAKHIESSDRFRIQFSPGQSELGVSIYSEKANREFQNTYHLQYK